MRQATLVCVALISGILTSSAPTEAATIIFNLSSPANGVLTSDFDDPTPLNGIASIDYVNAAVVIGSVQGEYASPNGSDVFNYVSVFAGGSATAHLTNPSTYLGLLWGSVDDYNSISFYANDVDQVPLKTFTGVDVSGIAPHQGYLNFFSDTPFSKVVFASSYNSFEFDNVSVSAVPIPASLPLFGSAIGLSCFMVGWQKRKSSKSRLRYLTS